MECYEINRAVDDLVRIFCEKEYADTTIATHRRNIQRVVNLHYACGTQFYNPQIVEQYIAGLRESYKSGRISRSQKNALVKSALYVCEIATTGTIAAGAKVVPDKLSPYYRMILDEIQKSESWNEGLKRNVVCAAHTYFRFLADSNIQDVSSITENTIRCYIMLKASAMNPNSLNTVRRNLKHLHHWLNEEGYISCNFSDVLSFTTPCTHKISKPMPHDEMARVFQSINRNTGIGKRDYAMFMIAAVTGMRSIDISELQLSDIDWVTGEIRITQKKTDAPLALPLTHDIGEALRDYILHGRPRSNFGNVFLTSRPPIQPLGRRGIYSAFNRVREIAGLKKRPFHDLRRAVGTSMVVAGIPVTTVAQVLGHTEISSTKQYISLDSTHLKECSLGLAGIEQTGGSAYE